MPARGFRFRPPEVPISAEIDWILARAFGPPDAWRAAPIDGDEAVGLAILLDLGPRIAARAGRRRLREELGDDRADRLMDERVAAATAALRVVNAAREVAALAARVAMPVAVLKFLALRETATLLSGSRAVLDLDLLAPADRAAELQGMLETAGFSPDETHQGEHHLAPLTHPRLGMVEIHRMMIGVRLEPGGPSVTLDDLAGRHRLRRLDRLPGECFAPDQGALAAHLVVHGLSQHGLRPSSYPLMRMLADLTDLGLGGPRGRDLAAEAAELIRADVSEIELGALRELCRGLARGRPASVHSAGHAGLLLRHILAGSLDERYGKALELRFLAGRLSDRGRASGFIQTARRQLGAASLAETYGPSRGRLDHLGKAIRRLFGLARQAAAHLGHALIYSLRGRVGGRT